MNMIIADPAAAYSRGVGNALSLGTGLAQAQLQRDQIEQQNALAQYLTQNGAAIMAGDTNALAGLMGHDPRMAMQIGQQQQANARADREFDFRQQQVSRSNAREDQRFQMEVERFAATKSAGERQALAERIRQGAQAGSAATTPEQWDQLVTQFGAPDLVGQFANREAILSQYLTAAQTLERMAGPSEADQLALEGARISNQQAQLNLDQDRRGPPVQRILDPQEVELRGFAPGTVVQESAQGEINVLQQPPRSGTNVTVNNAGQMPGLSRLGEGMTYLYNPDGTVRVDERGMPLSAPIPGTDAAREREEADARAMRQEQSQQDTANLVSEDLGRAKERILRNPALTTGFMGEFLRGWAGTPAADVSALLDTVGANISFDYLNQMRQNSPTGGALGNVTERELDLLRATAGSLAQAQSAPQLIENIERLERQMAEIIHGPGSQGAEPVVIDGFTIREVR